jgi:hypothetical protein
MGNVDAIISLLSNDNDAFHTLQGDGVKIEDLVHDYSVELKIGEMKEITDEHQYELSFFCGESTHKRFNFDSKSTFEHTLKEIFQLQEINSDKIQEGPEFLNVHKFNDKNEYRLLKRLPTKEEASKDNKIRFSFIFSDFFNEGEWSEIENKIFDRISSSTDLVISTCAKFNSRFHSLRKEKELRNSCIYTVNDIKSLGQDFVNHFEVEILDLIHSSNFREILDFFSGEQETLEKTVRKFFTNQQTTHPSLPVWKTKAVLSNICVQSADKFENFKLKLTQKFYHQSLNDRKWELDARPQLQQIGMCRGNADLKSPCHYVRVAFRRRTSQSYWWEEFSQSYNIANRINPLVDSPQNLYGIEVTDSATKVDDFNFDLAYHDLESFCETHGACDCTCHDFAKNPRIWKYIHAYESNVSLNNNPHNDDFIPYGVKPHAENFSKHLAERYRKFNRKKNGLFVKGVLR